MKKNYKYYLLGSISIGILLTIALIPTLININNTKDNRILKLQPQSMIGKQNPMINKKKAGDFYYRNKKSFQLNNYKLGMVKIYNITGMKLGFNDDKNVKINYISPSSNAAESGLKVDDVILSINNTLINSTTPIDISKLMINSNNKLITLQVERSGEKLSFTLEI
jgi:C-terminal processing protease CtpA/Prc|tara:strand:- start:580 stop:1077 length:498 start_codon:yes stop_codon:yes gene_type:complete